MAELKDSGSRREFESGAVRDIQEGKGRCDLLPLDTVKNIFEYFGTNSGIPELFNYIHMFQETGDVSYLYKVLAQYSSIYYSGSFDIMFLEVSKQFEDGAKKYGECNWQKGIPINCYIDSAVRHLLKNHQGYKDEPHDRAFVWNILCCIWTCEHKPELNVYKKSKCCDALTIAIKKFGEAAASLY